MGKQGINLLNTKREVNSKNKLFGKLKTGSIFFLFVYIVITVGVFSAYTFISQKGDSLKREISDTQNQIKNYQKIEMQEVSLKQRVGAIDGIISSSLDINQLTDKIQQIITGSGVLMGELSIDGKNITLSVSVVDERTLRAFLSVLDNSQNLFSRAEVGPFSRGKDGKYSFSIKVTI